MNANDSKHTYGEPEHEMDWAAFDALTDDDIKAAIARDPDAPRILDEKWFETAELVAPGRKRALSIRLDEEVLAYFTEGGPGYQTRINAVLLNYVRRRRGFSIFRELFRKHRAEHAGGPEARPEQVVRRPALFVKKNRPSGETAGRG